MSESPWDAEVVNRRRLELVVTNPATAPQEGGVLVIDDSGDRKGGTKTAHVARQYLGSIGKIDGGIVAVTSLWADEHVYYPLHVEPYTPAERLAGGKRDAAFRTKPQIAIELVDAALALGLPFRAIVAPMAVSVAASMRNCHKIVPRVAPNAFRTPISRVRSVTLIIMIATTPIPPTSRPTPDKAIMTMKNIPVTLPHVSNNLSCVMTAKLSG